ncbi:MAG: hypothetical protein OEW57_14595, partial [Gammaproteobacteria bacterium]|nr:hypothetical protein [Gammaproteobacteria bacterium]
QIGRAGGAGHFGTSENAAKAQVWIAMSVYVLVAIVRTRLRLGASLYETLQILSLTMFETTPWINCLCHIHRMQFRQIHRVI